MLQEQPKIPGAAESIVDPETVVDEELIDTDKFLSLARIAYEEGQDYYDKNLRKRFNDNYNIARSEHPASSKYRTEAYKYKSKTFRGKTEASIRKNEAAAAVALFTNNDVVTITAENQDDKQQDAVSQGLMRLTNFRLDGLKWFLLSVGAYHETMVPGVVFSKQYWDTDEGSPIIELIPPEYIKISPSADWLDPINSSPYMVIPTPMYVCDIKERMGTDWIELTDAQITSAMTSDDEKETDESRQGESSAKEDSQSSITDFSIVYVHENYIKKDGVDWHFYSLGTSFVLSDILPVAEVYPHTLITRKRNVQMGVSTITPFSVYKRSLVDRVKGSQTISNELVNLRFDNVKQVINKRYIALRGAGTDYSTLKRSVAGSVILTNDMNGLKPEEVRDVTPSSYQEQHMINADFDELAGSFSNASVATNRQLNDTVGGMQMLQSNSNVLTEYQLRVFVETWVEPVLREFVAMEQTYESDDIIQLVSGVQGLNRQALNIPMKLRVSVGFGATDPNNKVKNLLSGIGTIGKLFPTELKRFDPQAISSEVFGALGYGDGDKFFLPQEADPQVQALMDQLRQLVKIIESKQIDHQYDMELEQLKGSILLRVKELERNTKLTGMSLDSNHKERKLSTDGKTSSADISLKTIAAASKMLNERTEERELNAKISGQVKQGI